MILEHIDIHGFRGINRLSLPLTDTNLLIGENAWGKSSLLDALTLLLAPAAEPYMFTEQDFHFPPGEVEAGGISCSWCFAFARRAMSMKRCLRRSGNRMTRGAICASVRWRRAGNEVKTRWRFIDARGEVLPLAGTDVALAQLRAYYPVLRLRDARFGRRRAITTTTRSDALIR